MIKVFIADDHILIREGFKKILEKEIDMKYIGEAKTAAETMEKIRKLDCDVIVLDIGLPDKSGLELIKDIKAFRNEIKILILSMYPEDRFAIRALKAGALGYLTKESATDELTKAIRKVNEGRKYISENLAEHLAYSLDTNPEKATYESLSEREFTVLRKIGEGKSVTAIAEELSLSISTVNTYRKRLLEKLGIKTNAGLIHYVLKNNLLN